jgi:Zinc knuckle
VQAIANKQYSKKVEDLTAEELEKAEEAAEEGYLAYIMIMNSSTEHNKLKTSLADDYANGQDTYLKNRQDALCLLDTFTRNAPLRAIESEGGTFATTKKLSKKEQDEAYWKDKECYNCGETGHPARDCPNKKEAKSKKDKDNKKGKTKPKDDTSDEHSVESKKKHQE